MFLFDTDTVTWTQEGHQGIAARIRQVGEENIATTLVTEVEILRGFFRWFVRLNLKRFMTGALRQLGSFGDHRR